MERKTFSKVQIYVRDSYNRAGKLADVGDFAGAVELLAPVAARNPEVPQIFERLRLCEIAKAKKQNFMVKASAIFLSLFTAPVIAVMILIDPVKAMAMCEKPLAFCVDNPLILLALAGASDAADAPWGTVSALNVIRILHGGSIPLLKRLAGAMQRNNQSGEALKIHQYLLNSNPNNMVLKEELRAAMALASLERGRWDEEGSTQQKSQQAGKGKEGDGKGGNGGKGGDAALQQLLDGTIHDAEQAQMVIDKFTELLGKNDSVDMRRKLADAYMVAGKFVDAVREYQSVEKALGVKDPVLDKQIERAYLSELERQIAEAEQLPGNEAKVAELTETRNAYHRRHVTERASLFPNDPQLQFDLGELYFEDGDPEHAKEIFTQVADFPQKRRASLVYLGRCAILGNDPAGAVVHLEEAIKDMYRMDKYKREALYYLGNAFEMAGNGSMALDCYKKIRLSMENYRDISERISVLENAGTEPPAE